MGDLGDDDAIHVAALDVLLKTLRAEIAKGKPPNYDKADPRWTLDSIGTRVNQLIRSLGANTGSAEIWKTRHDAARETLRDRFAARALAGLVQVIQLGRPQAHDSENIAAWAYELADAMLEARKKAPEVTP